MGRTCDNCGIKLPMFVPRKRDEDGRLLCEGCHPDGKGSEGRPIGLHGTKKNTKVRDTYDKLTLACEACRTPMGENGLIVEAGKLVCPEGCKAAATLVSDPDTEDDNPPVDPNQPEPVVDYHRALDRYMKQVHDMRQPQKNPYKVSSTTRRRQSHDPEHPDGDDSLWCGLCDDYLGAPCPGGCGLKVCERCAGEHACPGPRKMALLFVAHDSGDGATIYHCPFCGSGQVTGGADGTVECDFCKSFFTVQVQPERPAMPQTVNGQPQQMPGMPGDGSQPAPFGGAPTDPGAGGDAFIPPDPNEALTNALQGVPAFAPPTPVTSSKTAYYLTEEGLLPEDSYIRHLAIKHADDREAVLDQVRSERK